MKHLLLERNIDFLVRVAMAERAVVEGIEERVGKEDPGKAFGVEIVRHHCAIGDALLDIQLVEDIGEVGVALRLLQFGGEGADQPETVLCGELKLPFGLIGFVTDYANEAVPGDPTPVAKLIELMGRSTAILADVVLRALARLAAAPARPSGTVYRFERG